MNLKSLFTFATLLLAGGLETKGIVAEYQVNASFVAGGGDYAEYLGDEFEFNIDGTGAFAFEIPSWSEFDGSGTLSFRAEQIKTPLSLAIGPALFLFNGAVNFIYDYANQHIGITFSGNNAQAVFNFYGPGIQEDANFDLSELANLPGYLDFYHDNGSHLYTDWDINLRGGAIEEPVVVPDGGASFTLLSLSFLGLLALRKLLSD